MSGLVGSLLHVWLQQWSWGRLLLRESIFLERGQHVVTICKGNDAHGHSHGDVNYVSSSPSSKGPKRKSGVQLDGSMVGGAKSEAHVITQRINHQCYREATFWFVSRTFDLTACLKVLGFLHIRYEKCTMHFGIKRESIHLEHFGYTDQSLPRSHLPRAVWALGQVRCNAMQCAAFTLY
jgi:hypothetical protein